MKKAYLFLTLYIYSILLLFKFAAFFDTLLSAKSLEWNIIENSDLISCVGLLSFTSVFYYLFREQVKYKLPKF